MLETWTFIHACELEAFPEIAKWDLISLEVVPQSPSLYLILRMH